MTGATGYIGSRLAHKLIERGHIVEALVRTPDKAGDLRALGAYLHQGDITDKDSMRNPMSGADGVFHVAGWYKVGARDSSMGYAVNAEGTRNVLSLMAELRVPKGVYTSTLAVNSDTGGRVVDEDYHFVGVHLSEYDRTKALAHDIADDMIADGLPLVIVMPGLVYGKDDPSAAGNTLRQYLQGRLPLVPVGSGYCWGHVDDIVEAHILAMEKGTPGESYIIGGEPHTLVDALEMAARITKIPVPRMRASPGMMRLMASVMQPVSRVIDLPEMFHPETLRVTAGVTYYGSNAKAKRELGYDPRPLDVGLREVLQYEMWMLGLRSPTL